MKATDLLEEQHRIVASLFERIEHCGAHDERCALFDTLARHLTAHDMIEREIFYPACRKQLGLTGLVGEAVAEHGVVRFCLYLAHESLGRHDFLFRLLALKEVVERHMKEEESDFFPKVNRWLEHEVQIELASRMTRRFESAMRTDYRSHLQESRRLAREEAVREAATAEKTERAPAHGSTRYLSATRRTPRSIDAAN